MGSPAIGSGPSEAGPGSTPTSLGSPTDQPPSEAAGKGPTPSSTAAVCPSVSAAAPLGAGEGANNGVSSFRTVGPLTTPSSSPPALQGTSVGGGAGFTVSLGAETSAPSNARDRADASEREPAATGGDGCSRGAGAGRVTATFGARSKPQTMAAMRKSARAKR